MPVNDLVSSATLTHLFRQHIRRRVTELLVHGVYSICFVSSSCCVAAITRIRLTEDSAATVSSNNFTVVIHQPGDKGSLRLMSYIVSCEDSLNRLPAYETYFSFPFPDRCVQRVGDNDTL